MDKTKNKNIKYLSQDKKINIRRFKPLFIKI